MDADSELMDLESEWLEEARGGLPDSKYSVSSTAPHYSGCALRLSPGSI